MAHSKSRWDGIVRQRDAKKAASVDEGGLAIGDIAGWERRVEAAIERGDPFLVLRHLKPAEVRYPGLGRRLAEAVLGPFLALKEVEELRSPKFLVLEEHRRIWEAVEGLGLVPLVRRGPVCVTAGGAASGAYTLVVDLREYAIHRVAGPSGNPPGALKERLDDEVAFD